MILVASTLFLISALANIGIGCYVLSKSPQCPKNQALFVYALGCALWVGGFGLLLWTEASPFILILNSGGVIALLGIYMLSQVFSSSESPARSVVWYLPFPIALCVATYPGLLVGEVTYAQHTVTPVQGPLFGYYSAWFAAYTLLSIYFFYRTYRLATGTSRRQLQYLFLGVGSFAAVAVACDVILPAMGIFALNTLGPIISVFAVGAIGYAIVRHQLLDIRVVLQRGLIFSAVLGGILILYCFLLGLISVVLMEVTASADVLVATVALAVGIFGSSRIESFVRKVTNPLFFAKKYTITDVLVQLSRMRKQTTSLTALIDTSVAAIDCLLQPEFVSFVAQPADSVSRRYALRVPVRVEKNLIGEFVLGPRRSGAVYSREDRSMLHMFSQHIAQAYIAERNLKRKQDLHQQAEQHQQSLDEIAHAFQSPLTVLKSGIDVLRTTPAHPQRRVFSSMESTVDSLSHLVRTMLELSRTSQKSEQHVQRVSLSSILEQTVEYAQIVAAANDINVETVIQPDITILGSERDIEEIVTNLLSNAIRYTANCENRTIRVIATKMGSQVVLSVSDSGIGISKEALPHVFERFYRATTDSTRPGHGLGLAIVKKLIERHNGTITIDSAVGAGTTVTVSFPA